MKGSTIVVSNDIIISASRGNVKDFEVIMKRFEKPVYNFVCRMVGEKPESADITQEVFIKVYRSLPDYDNDYRFSTWIFTITKRTVYDWLRFEKRKNEVLMVDDPAWDFDVKDEKAEKSLSREFDVKKAMNSIREDYRAVLWLYYYEQYTYKEIARIMDVPINTVKTLLYRAKRAFAKKMKNP